MEVFSTDLLVYRSAVYPQWRTFKYGQGGRLGMQQLRPELATSRMIGEVGIEASQTIGRMIPYNIRYDTIHFTRVYKISDTTRSKKKTLQNIHNL